MGDSNVKEAFECWKYNIDDRKINRKFDDDEIEMK